MISSPPVAAASSAAIAHLPPPILRCTFSRRLRKPPSSALPSSPHRRLFYGGVTPWVGDTKSEWHLSSLTKRMSVVVRGSSGNSSEQSKAPFGYTRKDVVLIGAGVMVLGVGLKYGLEFAGFDPMQAGNVVQLVIVLGLTVGWISTYIFRVSNKEMTYAQQLRDYENRVMQKRLESLTEAELEALLEQVEEEKGGQGSGEQIR